MDVGGQFSLLGERRFAPFFLTQFLGAFNDNVFKQSLITLIAFQGAHLLTTSADTLINLAAGLFMLPFFLFAATGGQMADKYEKSQLIRLIKLLEVVIMACAAIGLLLQSVPLLLGLLFLMGTQSALFAPVKYGIIPQILRDHELVGGNALVETGTFLAILFGTMGGTQLIAAGQSGAMLTALAVVLVAVLGYAASRSIPPVAPVDPLLRINWNPLTETWHILHFARANRTVFLSILGIAWFWFLGTIYVVQLPNYTRLTLGGNEDVLTMLIVLFSIGIGMGSLLCERLSDRKVEIGLVPFGSIGLTLFGLDLFFASPFTKGPATGATLLGAGEFLRSAGGWRVLTDIALVGVFGGLYIVPLYALVQQRSEPSRLSRIIAANNILSAFFTVLSAAAAIALITAGLTIPQMFCVAALMNAVVAIYIYTLVPEFLMRFLMWLLIHSMYRVKKEGLERVPDEGAAVLVCNHVSFVDALVIGACVRRPIRFVMYHKIFSLPILRFVFRTAKAIPIAPAREDPQMLERGFEQVSHALQSGELVCIFPEGQITDDGELKHFRPGIEQIISRDPVPVIPLALRGLWGSFFSRQGGGAMRRLPRGLFTRIGFTVGNPLPPAQVSASTLEAAVLALRGERR